MRKRFTFAREDRPGQDWLARFRAGWDEAWRWYLGEGRAAPPSAMECRDALRRHMPELIPLYDRVCALVGDDDLAHRLLSQYRPAPAGGGCTQAVWLAHDGPALVRNYDYRPDIVSARFELTAWSGRRVIGKAQRPWGGCLDGMNDDGLVASTTFGGSPAQGAGFSIILVLRYVLETCSRVDQAVAALRRIPIAQSQNVTLLDRGGAHATLFLGPDRTAAVTTDRVCTNHQEHVTWPEHGAISRTVERHDATLQYLGQPGMTLEGLIDRFLAPPLYSGSAAAPTVYTAVYWPARGLVDYVWPGKRWRQAFDYFTPGEYTHNYGELVSERTG
jgi:predicted choloylglycine hydrolase